MDNREAVWANFGAGSGDVHRMSQLKIMSCNVEALSELEEFEILDDMSRFDVDIFAAHTNQEE